jgi:exosome complex RNA-binding protein Rrp42 (RNase PH superfamily)
LFNKDHYICNINTDDFIIPKSKSSLKVFVDVLLLSYPHLNLMSTISTGIVSAFSTLQIPIAKALINEITGEEQIEV